MSKENNYCVYLHLDTSGVIRYVGSGRKTRPYFNFNRNSAWVKVFGENRPNVIIVEEGLSKDDSISLENYLYHSCLDTICNASEPRPVKDMDYDLFNSRFILDPLSPTGISIRNKHHASRKSIGDNVGSITTCNAGKKYWKISVNAKRYLVHRVVYLLAYGSLPVDKVINHIDGNGLNNSLSNLEAVPQKVNCFKRKVRSDNVLGFLGISELFYKGKVDAYISKYSNENGEKITQRFSIVAFGSHDLALQAAKDWRQYFLDKVGTEKYNGDLQELKSKVIEHLVVINKLRSNSDAYKTPNGKFACRLKTPVTGYKSCGVFDTKEEAVTAKARLIEQYNNSITIEI